MERTERELSQAEKEERARKQIQAGQYMNDIRSRQGISLAKLGSALGFSANYLSEVERGVKPPSDALIKLFCEYFKCDNGEIYALLGRPPIDFQEELEDSEILQELVGLIGKNKKLKPKKKEKIYAELLNWYKEVIDKDKH